MTMEMSWVYNQPTNQMKCVTENGTNDSASIPNQTKKL